MANSIKCLFCGGSKFLRRSEYFSIKTQRNCTNVAVKETSKQHHVPVMSNEVVQLLRPKDKQVIVDMTFGGGGHTRSILDSAPGVKVVALDRDPFAHQLATAMADKYPGRLISLLGKFSDLECLLEQHQLREDGIDAFLFDVGCSSMQFDTPCRGFALSSNGPLDMRMDGNRNSDQPTAADVVNNLDEVSLAKILKTYGEERHAKLIARAIVEARFLFRTLRTTHELAELVASVINRDERLDKLERPAHPATKTFQALRIFVNNELNELNHGLDVAHRLLKDCGVVVALTFHSLEDRIVKRHLMGIDMNEPVSSNLSQKYRNADAWHSRDEVLSLLDKKWTPFNPKVLTPTEEEISRNPRSRSAKLRAASKNPQLETHTATVTS